jgi:hypothetical protein
MEPIVLDLPQRQIDELAAIARAEQSTVAQVIGRAVGAYVLRAAAAASAPNAPAVSARRRTDRRSAPFRSRLDW